MQQHPSRSFLANTSNGLSSGGVSGSSGSALIPTTTQGLNNNVFENGGLLSKRFSSPSSTVTGGNGGAGGSNGLGPLGNLGDLSTGLNPYEKWSNGSDKLFDQHTSDSILELSSKLLNLGKSPYSYTSFILVVWFLHFDLSQKMRRNFQSGFERSKYIERSSLWKQHLFLSLIVFLRIFDDESKVDKYFRRYFFF